MNENFDHINEELLVKYLLDEATAEERTLVETWIKESADNQKYFEQFRLIWDESKKLQPMQKADEDVAWKKFQQRISKPARRSQPFPFLRIAALFILIAGVSLVAYFLLRKENLQMLTARSTNAIVNDTLPDGSVITLNKNSSLTYPEKFKGDDRAVTLEGEAFFHVTPDRKKPFLIHVNDVTIRVVGTSFNVRSSNGITEVIVETGIVQVIKKNKLVELRPGEMTVVGAKDSLLQKRPETDQLYNYYRSKQFVCDNTPLWKLVEVLNEAYQVNIVIERPELRSLPLTVTFSNESLDQVLKVISLTANVEVIQSKEKIILR